MWNFSARIHPTAFIRSLIVTSLISSGTAQPADTILFTHAHIYGYPGADAVLVTGGKIVGIGKQDSFPGFPTTDLKGGYLYPGFTDSHIHLTGYGRSLETLNLVGTKTKSEILKLLLQAVKQKPPGTWILGRGWDQNDWPETEFPTKTDLDSIAPQHYVVLRRVDGHAIWVNSLVLKKAGIRSATPDPEGGRILRDASGKPTGILIDNAVSLVNQLIAAPTPADKRRSILKALKQLNQFGLTAIHDAGTDLETLSILKELKQEGKLTLRVYAILDNEPSVYSSYLQSGPETENPFYQVRCLKLYLDGALGSRGAALLEPYSDDPGNKGLILTDSAEVARLVKEFNSRGFQVAIHCIGDRANRIALDIFEAVGATTKRNRIEHAQIINPADIPRFHRLGVIPSMQATHCTSDMYWADERLGDQRLAGAYAWQSLIKAGSIIPGGSDAPVETPDPLAGIYAALTRQDPKGWPPGGWQPQERLQLEQALKMITEWAAYASFQEQVVGKLEPDYYADFTVLDRPLDGKHPNAILHTRVLFTIVNGKIVYQGKD
jgi:predicted amidohydrolase YtcJ